MQTRHWFYSTGLTLVLSAAFWLGTVAAASAQSPAPGAGPTAADGADTFRQYCAVCHGPNATGDGPLAASMRRRPANLTEIMKRGKGLFPDEDVFRIIDGRQPVKGHGGPDMPVWGDAFKQSMVGGDDANVRLRIQSLVLFLKSIQARII
jgi:mono/diheme cytochrome c family protein